VALFKRKYIERILEGRKVQTRRIHRGEWKLGRTYAIKDRWFGKPKGHIVITRKFRERLGDISLEDVQKEGYGNLEDFRKAWEEIHGLGSWNPDLVVTVYEFRVCSRRGKPRALTQKR
jgi:hypothetical protein